MFIDEYREIKILTILIPPVVFTITLYIGNKAYVILTVITKIVYVLP